MPTIRTLYKQGNSIVLSVPSYVADWLGCAVGDKVTIDLEEGPRVVLRSAQSKPKQWLDGINPHTLDTDSS